MPRKKRTQKRSQAQKKANSKPEAFNPAFKPLKQFRRERQPAPETDKKPSGGRGRTEPDEMLLFHEAMSDVEPLNSPRRKIIPTPDANVRPAHPAPDDELEAMAILSDLVSGNAEMDITFSDEYIEGAVLGVSRKLMQRLRKGHVPIQDHIDLHGLTKQQAKTTVHDFLLQSYRKGLRCVLVVHGRGLNSENHIPVLKERLPNWLTRGPVRKIVLAFSTAKPYDGGTGAIYVLLRKVKGG